MEHESDDNTIVISVLGTVMKVLVLEVEDLEIRGLVETI